MHTEAPHEGQRAVSVRSSIFMSDEKSNELFAPHLQGTYFLRETMNTTPWFSDIARQGDADGTTKKRNDAAINNAYSTVTLFAKLRGLSGSFLIFTAM